MGVGVGESAAREGALISMAICLALGLVLIAAGRGYSSDQILRREEARSGCLRLGGLPRPLGALPYMLSGALPHPSTRSSRACPGSPPPGSTVLVDIEAVPKSILFWRCFTQWLGGIGIIVLFIADSAPHGRGGSAPVPVGDPGNG